MALKRVAAGLAIGYVLGAKAGDKRYKEIRGRWEDILKNPMVQRALEGGRSLAASGGQRALGAVRERFGAESVEDEPGKPRDESGESDGGRKVRRGGQRSRRPDEGDEKPRTRSEDEDHDEDAEDDEDPQASDEDEEGDQDAEDPQASDEDEEGDQDAEDPQASHEDEDENDGIFGTLGRTASQIRERGRVA